MHTDALGSPVAYTSSTGSVLAGRRTQYEPYGTPTTTPRNGEPSYTGHQYDQTTGLIYAQARFYDPTLGRFLSPDPMAVDTTSAFNFNRYAYANNSPYKFTDPDGRDADDILGSDLTDAIAVEYLSQFAPQPGSAEHGALFSRDGGMQPLGDCSNRRCSAEVNTRDASFVAHTHEATTADGVVGYVTNELRELPTVPGDDAVLKNVKVPNYVRTPTNAVRVLERKDGSLRTRTVRGKDHRYQGEKRESNSDRKKLIEKLRKDHQRGRKHEAE